MSNYRLISSRKLQANCVISYFYIYLMFHVYAARFDVTENLEIFLDLDELNKAILYTNIRSINHLARPPLLIINLQRSSS